MKYVSLRSASFIAAVAIATVSTVALHAQAPPPGAQSAAAAPAPGDVNVVNVPTVTVGNTDLQPIPVKEPVKEPVYLNFQLQIVQPYSISHNNALYAIPAGKRLTIEHTSLLCASDTVKEAYGAVIANGRALTYLPTHSFPTETGTGSTSPRLGSSARSARRSTSPASWAGGPRSGRAPRSRAASASAARSSRPTSAK